MLLSSSREHSAVLILGASHYHGGLSLLEEISMPVVLVANPKGGVGKSTLATNIAGYFASRGHAVMLGDVDRQQSSRLWLGLRPPQASDHLDLGRHRGQQRGAPAARHHPCGARHAGRPARLALQGCDRLADKLIVPLQPSIFDIYATREFIDRLLEQRRAEKTQIGLVGMRVNARTLAADRLNEFIAGWACRWSASCATRRTTCSSRRADSPCSTSRRDGCSATSSNGSRSANGSTAEPPRAWAPQVFPEAACRGADTRGRGLAARVRRMTKKTFQTLQDLAACVGQEVAVSDWITITQEQVNQFAEATGDHQWIHRRPRAREGRSLRRADRPRLPHPVAAAALLRDRA